VLRWAAAAALECEKRFRKISGFQDLWMLKAALEEGRLPSEKSLITIDEDRVAAQDTRASRPTLHYGWDIIARSAFSRRAP